MNLITLEDIYKSYSDKTLLENIKFTITNEDKIGVIGINGTGKSTLLKIIAGIETFESGHITKMNGLTMEYLPQEVVYEEEDTVLEQVFKGSSEVMKVLREYEDTLHKLSLDSNNTVLQKTLISLQSKMDALNGWQLESEAKRILTRLGISNFDDKMKVLSGGQRKRVALASSLISPCDLLILDEPTNHMDNNIIEWMENELRNRKSALLMITHDRYFLDRVANKIIEIDSGNIYEYTGNYSTFIEKKLERIELMQSLERKRQNLYRRELAWVKRGAKARSTKQKARLERFEDIKNSKIEIKDNKIDISTGSSRLGKKIINVEHIYKSFGEKQLIKDFSYIATKEDRVGIVGENGIGKSTLLNILSGRLDADSGIVEFGDTVKLGYFTQENGEMNDELRVIDYIKEIAEFIITKDGSKISASQMLERFMFEGAMQYTPISKLSGGEKRRLYLLRILMESPNVLFLDEPTNDLDIDTLTILEEYLEEFNGSVITVSHDRYFLDKIANQIFAFQGHGEILKITGNYSDYKEYSEVYLIDEKKDEIINKNREVKKEQVKKEKILKFSYKEMKEYEEIDEKIEEKENELDEVKKSISNGGSDFILLQELLEKQNKIEEELDYLMERWTYLNELCEQIKKNKENNL
ncbi:ABC-F family ATP-binding cassette domain-containing protein [Clostridium butanoliproducens]|uniref:ABC-F family ATP-binding cassette domain-containing protein n=1 Tax=Clostridium butanoliproducens TaxID=2991837 RepID=UPI0024BB60FA|nr:ABC-F family ATP-binding cassette domain-containing protein [Clostridium butanoliproducens]MDU1348873.1 ABC-F family ATP-binding cassette domain-containing protein [Clostridium argentinense]